jgi:plastocyanin
MSRAAPRAILAALVALALTASPVAAAPVDVAIRSISYDPSAVNLATQGRVVRWTNVTMPNRAHDVVSSLPAYFASELLASGETFSFQFRSAGTFTYICSIHDVMLGAISVPVAGTLEAVGDRTYIRIRAGTVLFRREDRYRYVLLRRGPGDPAFRVWRIGRGNEATMEARLAGEYRFKVRLKDRIEKRPSADSPMLTLVYQP